MTVKKDSLSVARTVETFDRATGTFYVQRVEDIEPVLEENAYARNHQGNNGFGKSRNWRKIASIPCVVVEQIMRERGVDITAGTPEAERELRKFLRDNYKFRTVDRL